MAGAWEVFTPPAVAALLQQLRGQTLGLGNAIWLLERDPCAPELNARRLSGPLQPVVCRTHLNRGYRLAFTTQPAAPHHAQRVVILYVGERDTRNRARDIWSVLHDLFGVPNPPEGHLLPHCCADGLPAIDEDTLAAFERRLARLVRGR